MTFNVIITHHPDTTIAGCHGDTSFLFHREPEEIIGKKLAELGIIFYDEQERPLTDGELPVQCIAAGKKPLSPFQLGFAREKGKPSFRVRVIGYQELDKSGKVSKIITSYTGMVEEPQQDPVAPVDFEKESNWEKTFNAIGDISKEKQLQQQLQQAVKMEAIGTLAGGIAHDFNNILAAMIGYAQIAKGKLQGNDPADADLEEVLRAGDRAADLVKQILTFSRQDKMDALYPTKIQFLLKEVIKLLRSSLPSTIEIRQDIDNGSAPILADPTQIHQILMNLCTNAKQAIGNTYGSITITLKEYQVDDSPLFRQKILPAGGKYLHLSITDSGIGMSEEIQAKVFDPFFTTKPKNQGTGLGLAVVHGIVERHGGVITIDSTPDEGTTLHLFFPAINEKIEKHESNEAPAKGTERIMVVDDEKALAGMLKAMLNGLGYSVEIYTDSLAAVADYRQRPQDFDAIITDMTMPDMTGTELAREAFSLRPEIPVILMTGYSESIDEEKAARIGLSSFLCKPINRTELAKNLRRVLDHGIHTYN